MYGQSWKCLMWHEAQNAFQSAIMSNGQLCSFKIWDKKWLVWLLQPLSVRFKMHRCWASLLCCLTSFRSLLWAGGIPEDHRGVDCWTSSWNWLNISYCVRQDFLIVFLKLYVLGCFHHSVTVISMYLEHFPKNGQWSEGLNALQKLTKCCGFFNVL